MSPRYQPMQFSAPYPPRPRWLLAPAALAALGSASTMGSAVAPGEPLAFFEGRTEMISFVKVMTKKPYRSRTTGEGRILSDGSLSLVQEVDDANEPSRQRHWRMRKVAPQRYMGTMSEAVGPVNADVVDGSYRFRFRMKNGLVVEQWLTPLPGGQSARSRATIRKFGLQVAKSEGVVRRLS